MSVMVLMGSLELGLIYAVMALGVFISFRTLNMPDLSVDGSFVLGAAVSVVLSLNGHPFLGLGAAFIAGCGAGAITALLHTKLKIQPLLAGILTMLALYSVNLKVMGGRANIPLINKITVFSPFEEILRDYNKLGFSLAVLLLILFLLFLFLKTRLGFVLRATGDNDAMVRALGVNTDTIILVGLALSNGLVGVAGALIAQSQSFVDVGMGIGMVVIGLASVIIGEVVFGVSSLLRRLMAVILGSILYRLIIAFALELGMPPTDLKLVSAVIVAIAMAMPVFKKRLSIVKRKMSITPHERSK
ncbi:ABC transporter permease [Desulfosporosinus hippei]|uniref:Putative ABC transport system permease protein n=1 Tax=Desulfosporosinus hippei DSM 8344 TaxID=1121419 RepID=A0A1G7TNF2_9FIRM|nr:ABC transporter permease [Desulfosporosinus hippei]SDG36857.1 putative ABC transport system permease protein [Desulfosporosinus hippei DSM 8344]